MKRGINPELLLFEVHLFIASFSACLPSKIIIFLIIIVSFFEMDLNLAEVDVFLDVRAKPRLPA